MVERQSLVLVDLGRFAVLLRPCHFLYLLGHDGRLGHEDLVKELDMLVVRKGDEVDGEVDMDKEDKDYGRGKGDIHEEEGTALRDDTSCLGRVGVDQEGQILSLT